MSVRHGVLALLAEQPRHGYELRAEFERRTGSSLNVGQVYTTLARLERDGLVAGEGAGEAGQKDYRLTDDGAAALADWFASPVRREARPRDELAIKLALAVTSPGVDVRAVLQTQRTASLRALQDYTRLKARTGTGSEAEAWLLVLESMVFATEAEVRWLDHCEERLVHSRRPPSPRPAPVPAPEALR